MSDTANQIDHASVKVMLSYDYCHFEVCLSTSASPRYFIGIEEVDSLRKAAARLADKAVEQYKVAKVNAEKMAEDEVKLASLKYRHRDIVQKPEAERTPEEKAIVKALEDRAHWKRRRYDYDDEYEEEGEHYPDDDNDQDVAF